MKYQLFDRRRGIHLMTESTCIWHENRVNVLEQSSSTNFKIEFQEILSIFPHIPFNVGYLVFCLFVFWIQGHFMV